MHYNRNGNRNVRCCRRGALPQLWNWINYNTHNIWKSNYTLKTPLGLLLWFQAIFSRNIPRRITSLRCAEGETKHNNFVDSDLAVTPNHSERNRANDESIRKRIYCKWSKSKKNENRESSAVYCAAFKQKQPMKVYVCVYGSWTKSPCSNTQCLLIVVASYS